MRRCVADFVLLLLLVIIIEVWPQVLIRFRHANDEFRMSNNE